MLVRLQGVKKWTGADQIGLNPLPRINNLIMHKKPNCTGTYLHSLMKMLVTTGWDSQHFPSWIQTQALLPVTTEHLTKPRQDTINLIFRFCFKKPEEQTKGKCQKMTGGGKSWIEGKTHLAFSAGSYSYCLNVSRPGIFLYFRNWSHYLHIPSPSLI